MPSSVQITPRSIYIEDLATTTVPTGDTDQVEVLGAIGTQSLNKIPLVLLTQLVPAANDAGAAAGGVLVGQCYYSTTTLKIHTRMS